MNQTYFIPSEFSSYGESIHNQALHSLWGHFVKFIDSTNTRATPSTSCKNELQRKRLPFFVSLSRNPENLYEHKYSTFDYQQYSLVSSDTTSSYRGGNGSKNYICSTILGGVRSNKIVNDRDYSFKSFAGHHYLKGASQSHDELS